jgi:hypothetical protein
LLESFRKDGVGRYAGSEFEKKGLHMMFMNRDLNGVVVVDGQKVQKNYIQNTVRQSQIKEGSQLNFRVTKMQKLARKTTENQKKNEDLIINLQ